MKTPRDIFLDKLYEKAVNDNSIYLICVDLASPALKKWQENLPNQIIYCGISEQNAINLASGLASQNKKVYVFFMAAWMSRCLEQIRYSICMPNYPITIIGNGVGLGYAPAGPAHEPTEDIAYVRSLLNIDILSPSHSRCIENIVDETIQFPKIRYIRLERTLYLEIENCNYTYFQGFNVLGDENKNNTCLISYGHLLSKYINKSNINTSLTIIDLYHIMNSDYFKLKEIIEKFDNIITVEEQSLPGGFGSFILEYCNYNNIKCNIKRFGLPSIYIFDNGNRDYLLDKYELIKNTNDYINSLT